MRLLTEDELVAIWKRENPRAVALAKRLAKVGNRQPDFRSGYLRGDLVGYLNAESGAGMWLADYFGISCFSTEYYRLTVNTF